MIPQWLHILSIVSLILGGVCALWIAMRILLGDRQHMMVMDFVWPITALYAGPVGLWAYYRWGRKTTRANVQRAMNRNEGHPGKQRPFPESTAIGVTHCGSGCTLGDILAEWLAVLAPIVATWFGYHWLFGHKIFAVWILDYIFALGIGVAFQYFSIVPMKNLSPGRGLIEAFKADVLSLTAWQIGMYGFMAVAYFWIFSHLLDHKLHAASVEFWFMMQIAMFCGFATAYPVNWRLLRRGIKEAM